MLKLLGDEDNLPYHINPFVVLPPKNMNQVDRGWLLACHLQSGGEEGSIKDGISKELNSLQYITVEIMDCILKVGHGTQMAKTDIKHAYGNIPVHSDDCTFLVVQW